MSTQNLQTPSNRPLSSSTRSCRFLYQRDAPCNNDSRDPQCQLDSPLNCPLHREICDNHRRCPVEDLMGGPSECVEEGSVECASERALTIGAQSVRRNAFLWLGTCFADTSASSNHLLLESFPFSSRFLIQLRTSPYFLSVSPRQPDYIVDGEVLVVVHS
jgi:hypothetical protein